VFQTVYTHKNGILRVKVQLLYKKISIARHSQKWLKYALEIFGALGAL